tara:strand:+ start:328 stop:507 length:180 start_codon:yes stop_codon:yes gene_type:complete
MAYSPIALSVGYLDISIISAAFLLGISLLFLGSFVFVSLKNDNEGMMKWIFETKKSNKN